MGLRRAGRQRALQFLYALEFGGEGFDSTESNFVATNPKWRRGWSKFAKELARKTYEHRKELDAEIERVVEHWVMERLARMDRICIQMALCEMKWFPEIPLRVTLDEYIELARTFGTDDSPKFVNGVLDRLARDFRKEECKQIEPVEIPVPQSRDRHT
ncbi:transcription antitermination factor NusB [Candidatus Sumerlaeota bacterium]|nr:transcription antitermination factor NusB [Candidatus Sumerlaeota bacterium]